MSADFAVANSQRLRLSSPPISGPAFTIGMWAIIRATPSGTLTAWCLSNNGSLSDEYRITAFTSWGFACSSTGSGSTATGPSIAVGLWTFLLARAISTSNRRLAVLDGAGAITHAQDTTNRLPAGTNTFTIGGSELSPPQAFFDGQIAEFWYTNADIQADGGQLDNNMLWQLAYRGPFSFPHIRKDIIEYRSLRSFPSADGDAPGDVYSGAFGAQAWENVNAATIGPHIPLVQPYRSPIDRSVPLMI